MAESKAQRTGKGSAAELFANWRAAERDRAAALESACVAKLATETAQRAAHPKDAFQDAQRKGIPKDPG